MPGSGGPAAAPRRARAAAVLLLAGLAWRAADSTLALIRGAPEGDLVRAAFTDSTPGKVARAVAGLPGLGRDPAATAGLWAFLEHELPSDAVLLLHHPFQGPEGLAQLAQWTALVSLLAPRVLWPVTSLPPPATVRAGALGRRPLHLLELLPGAAPGAEWERLARFGEVALWRAR